MCSFSQGNFKPCSVPWILPSANHSDDDEKEEEGENYGDDDVVDKDKNHDAYNDVDLRAGSQDDDAKIHNGTVVGIFFHFNLEWYYVML